MIHQEQQIKSLILQKPNWVGSNFQYNEFAFLKVIYHQSLEAHVWYSLKFEYLPFRHILILPMQVYIIISTTIPSGNNIHLMIVK